MVMKCVPILGFYVDGYALGWAADAARGKNNVLPVNNFTRHTFIKGVLYAIINVLFFIASIWTFVLNLIPFVGFIAIFVVGLFANAFFALAAVRMAVKEKLGGAFDLSEIFAKYKKKFGGLIGATFVPSFIVGVIFAIIVAIVIGIATASAISSIYSMSNSLYGGYGAMMGNGSMNDAYGALSTLGSMGQALNDPFGFVLGMIQGLGLVVMLLALLYMFMSAFAEIWSLRAVGRWVEANAQDWAKCEEEPVANKAF